MTQSKIHLDPNLLLNACVLVMGFPLRIVSSYKKFVGPCFCIIYFDRCPRITMLRNIHGINWALSDSIFFLACVRPSVRSGTNVKTSPCCVFAFSRILARGGLLDPCQVICST